MSVEIIEVKNNKELKKFIKLPFDLYKNDQNWVPPLIGEQKKHLSPKHNPFFEHSKAALFLAYKNNKVVGRISAHTNEQHNKIKKDNLGFFGFFESIDDEEVAQKLFKKTVEWNKKQGKDSIRGPMNFSMHDECGLLIEGFDSPPFIMMTHNHPYYKKLYEKFGLSKIKDFYAYFIKQDSIPKRLEKFVKLIKKRYNYTVRTLSKNKKDLRKDIKTVLEIYSEAWKDNWGFVKMTEAEFKATVDELLPIVDKDLIFIAEVDGKPAGFSVAVPNYNFVLKKMKGHVNPWTIAKAFYYKNKISAVRVITMGVIKEYQKKGIESVMIYNTFKNGLSKGINQAELSWVLEDNVEMNNLAKKINSEIYKKYRLYEADFKKDRLSIN